MSTLSMKPLAVVTGGSSGIGFQLARQFALHGYDLLIAAEPAGLEEAAQKLSAEGANVESIGVDLAKYDGVDALYQKIKSTGRPVAAIAINAGVGVGGRFIEDTDLAEELNLINLNVVSSVHLAKHVIKDMVAQGEGKVLFTSSIAAIQPTPFETVYGASKAFILSLSEGLRSELKDTGVSVTALMPGPTETNFFHRADLDDTQVGASKKDAPEDVARQGFEALMAGKEKIIAGGFKTKMMGVASEILPDSVKAELHHKMAEPGSAKK